MSKTEKTKLIIMSNIKSNIINLSGDLNETYSIIPEIKNEKISDLPIYTIPFNKIQKINMTLTMNLAIKPNHFSIDYLNCKFYNNNLIKIIYKSPSIFLNGIYLNLPNDLIKESIIFADIPNIINGKLYFFFKTKNENLLVFIYILIEINNYLNKTILEKLQENEQLFKRINLLSNSNNSSNTVINNLDDVNHSKLKDTGLKDTELKEKLVKLYYTTKTNNTSKSNNTNDTYDTNNTCILPELLDLFEQYKLMKEDSKFSFNYYEDFIEKIELDDENYYLLKLNEVNNDIIKIILNNSENDSNFKFVFKITELRFRNSFQVMTSLNNKFI